MIDFDFKYFDTHTHPHFSEFEDDREQILQEMKEQKIAGIAVGTNKSTSAQAINIAKENDFIFSCIGIHPTVHEDFDEKYFTSLLAKENKVVAIGECGLDYFRKDKDDAKRQKILFEQQIQFAIKNNLPLMLHIRSSANSADAHQDAFEILQVYKKEFLNLHLHMHFFTASIDIARKFLELDATFGIPGVVTFARSVAETVNYIPAEKILTETDAPYAAPIPYRGQKNKPTYIKEISKKLAQIKNTDEKVFAQNAMKIFLNNF